MLRKGVLGHKELQSVSAILKDTDGGSGRTRDVH